MLQRVEHDRPAISPPRYVSYFELKTVSAKSFAEVATVFFNGVGGFVFAAKQRDDGLRHCCIRRIGMRRKTIVALLAKKWQV
jgi:hypothetical protein